jgi:gas vesicle protein
MSKQNDLIIGYLAGGVAAFIAMLFESSRSEVIPAFKASKEVKRNLQQVAKRRGWTLSQAAYVATSVGVEVLMEEDRKTGAIVPTETEKQTK